MSRAHPRESSLLDSATRCIAFLRGQLDGSRLTANDDSAHAPLAIALLSRMVFLCEAAIDLANTARRPAAAVLLRPAIECWIDCCYALYCQWEGVLQLSALGLREREKLARLWLGEEPVEEITEQQRQLENVVQLGIESGLLPRNFALRSSVSVETRLREAIEGRKASATYIEIYRYLYRGISTSEIHTSVAVDFHADMDEAESVFSVVPIEPFDVEALIALTVRLACGAAVDVFEILDLDQGELAALASQLDEGLAQATAALASVLDNDPSAEVKRALAELRRRQDGL